MASQMWIQSIEVKQHGEVGMKRDCEAEWNRLQSREITEKRMKIEVLWTGDWDGRQEGCNNVNFQEIPGGHTDHHIQR